MLMRLSYINLRLSPAPDHTFMTYDLVELLKNIEYLYIVVLTHSSGDAVLFNAEQSNTYCDSGTCRNASLAIDGDWNTASLTATATGTHWWQVSMSNILVYQIVLKAWSYPSGEITVSLYSGEKLAGQCKSHSGIRGTETLSCAKVTADRVRLTMSSPSWTYLGVVEITVYLTPGTCYVINAV